MSEFITDLDEAAYRQDALHRSAVERQLEIVGEALGNLRKHDPETAAAIPDLHRIVGLRNVLAHGYAVVDDAVVWTAAHHRTPELIVQINALLGESHDS